MDGTCSECGAPFRQWKGTRERLTCSPACSKKRVSRHATRERPTDRACSECGTAVKPPRKTCSDECARLRRNRQHTESMQPRQRACVDCGTVLTVPAGRRGGMPKRCKPCATKSTRSRGNAANTAKYRALSPARRRTLATWNAMKRRCLSVGNEHYPHYGERGIDIAPEWLTFEAFLADMGERPEGMTLDRIDVNGPYTRSNCRWATARTQSNNRRDNRRVSYRGREQTIAEWATEIGIPRGALFNRLMLYGWDVDSAMTTPVKKRAPRRPTVA